jgi:pantoate--beta-alanine ligase
MDLIHSIPELRARLKGVGIVAFVPTLGNLHDGHLSLVRMARQRGDCVVASIFVNRLQFDPGGDFDRYPRTLARDCEMLAKAGCDVVFAPDEHEIYPEPQQVMVVPPPAAEQLCGPFRPGHFQGVLTVVTKLFNIVQPQVAVFGKKDFQQLFLIRMLVRQMALPVEIVGADTVREADGLAMSSRNGYLDVEERAEAVRLSRNLKHIRRSIEGGSRDFVRLAESAAADLASHAWKVDYIAIRDRGRLEAPVAGDRELVVLGAAWLGKTRLIDNLEIDVEGGT